MPAEAGRARRPRCDWLAGAASGGSFCCVANWAVIWPSPIGPIRRRNSLGFAEIGPDKEVWEYAALVTSLDSEILTLGQLYRDRADCENVFDELRNQWGWGGFTTQDLTRCRLLAGTVALVYNWWSLFARLADPEHHREAITTGRCCCQRSPVEPSMPVR